MKIPFSCNLKFFSMVTLVICLIGCKNEEFSTNEQNLNLVSSTESIDVPDSNLDIDKSSSSTESSNQVDQDPFYYGMGINYDWAVGDTIIVPVRIDDISPNTYDDINVIEISSSIQSIDGLDHVNRLYTNFSKPFQTREYLMDYYDRNKEYYEHIITDTPYALIKGTISDADLRMPSSSIELSIDETKIFKFFKSYEEMTCFVNGEPTQEEMDSALGFTTITEEYERDSNNLGKKIKIYGECTIMVTFDAPSDEDIASGNLNGRIQIGLPNSNSIKLNLSLPISEYRDEYYAADKFVKENNIQSWTSYILVEGIYNYEESKGSYLTEGTYKFFDNEQAMIDYISN